MSWLKSLGTAIKQWFWPPLVTPSKPLPTPEPPPLDKDISLKLLAAHNAVRAGQRVQALQLDSQLMRAAAQQAIWEAAREQVTHYDRTGATVGERAYGVGYRWAAIGENVAQNDAGTPAVMIAWLQSPPHRDIILDSRYHDAGFAMAESLSGRHFWCAVFGTKLPEGTHESSITRQERIGGPFETKCGPKG